MTEPKRTITGLTPRTPPIARVTGDLSNLQAKNRTIATPAPQPPAPATQSATEPATQKPPNKPITVYIAPDVYKQARLAFMATRTSESDISWSHFVEKALAAEVQRRATQYNAGKPFEGKDAPLPSGRPLSDD